MNWRTAIRYVLAAAAVEGAVGHGDGALLVLLSHPDDLSWPVAELPDALVDLAGEGHACRIGASNRPTGRLPAPAQALTAHGTV